MIKAGKTYTTFNKVRLTLFVRSYTFYSITHYLRTKYKIDSKLKSKELRKKYFNKHVLPEITRLARVLNLNYKLLWQSIILNKNKPIGKRIFDKEGVKIYLSIENELIMVVMAKRKFIYKVTS